MKEIIKSFYFGEITCLFFPALFEAWSKINDKSIFLEFYYSFSWKWVLDAFSEQGLTFDLSLILTLKIINKSKIKAKNFTSIEEYDEWINCKFQ